jgi:Tfp pilus assembly protein PilN
VIRVPNLATRPLRNERLPAVLLGAALLALLALSVQHGLYLRRLLPDRTSVVEAEVRGLEGELQSLREQTERLPRAKPDARDRGEWEVIRGLVDRRAMSWAQLLAQLEDVMPPGVKLASIAPRVKDGRILLDMDAVGRTTRDGLGLLRALQKARDFDDVVPSSVGEVMGGGGAPDTGEIRYSMRYTPSGPEKKAAGPAALAVATELEPGAEP